MNRTEKEVLIFLEDLRGRGQRGRVCVENRLQRSKEDYIKKEKMLAG